mmetsp:Transcript_4468/g.12441  ORF Transcript_4468/g.12441 Transcript_4468/m.12441 type:complete len:219 (+) Transcript_4468:60-716(+)
MPFVRNSERSSREKALEHWANDWETNGANSHPPTSNPTSKRPPKIALVWNEKSRRGSNNREATTRWCNNWPKSRRNTTMATATRRRWPIPAPAFGAFANSIPRCGACPRRPSCWSPRRPSSPRSSWVWNPSGWRRFKIDANYCPTTWPWCVGVESNSPFSNKTCWIWCASSNNNNNMLTLGGRRLLSCQRMTFQTNSRLSFGAEGESLRQLLATNGCQ